MRIDVSALTKEQKECIIQELAKRFKDLVYSEAEEKAKEAFKQIPYMLDYDNDIRITYDICMSVDFIVQIISRLQRESDETT